MVGTTGARCLRCFAISAGRLDRVDERQAGSVSERGWQRKFDDPIETPDGTRLSTSREAVAYLAKTVPKSERDMPAVTTAA